MLANFHYNEKILSNYSETLFIATSDYPNFTTVMGYNCNNKRVIKVCYGSGIVMAYEYD